MKKNKFIIPILSTLLIAPAILAHQVSADAVAPATSTAPVEQVEAPKENQSVAPTTAQGDSAVSPATEASTEKVTEKSENKQVETSVTPADSTTPANQAVAAPTTQSEKDTVILHTNDVHGRIVEEKGVIGDAKLAAVIEQERAKTNQTTLVVDAGDAFQGLPISNSSKGEERANILNKIGYDAMAVGNHEFDFGLDEVKKYKEILKFPLLSANTYVNGARLFEASTIVDKDKNVVGDEFVVIGVTTPETATKTHPRNVQGVTFTDPFQKSIKSLKKWNLVRKRKVKLTNIMSFWRIWV